MRPVKLCIVLGGMAASLSHCGKAPAPLPSPPPQIVEFPKFPVYDQVFINERELEYAGLKGRREAALTLHDISHPEVRAVEEQMRAVERRIQHARNHLGEPYIHLEAP